MRTTLQLDEDVYAAAKALAESRGASLGVILSELARRGMRSVVAPGERSGFPVFVVPPGASLITPEMVQRGLEDECASST